MFPHGFIIFCLIELGMLYLAGDSIVEFLALRVKIISNLKKILMEDIKRNTIMFPNNHSKCV